MITPKGELVKVDKVYFLFKSRKLKLNNAERFVTDVVLSDVYKDSRGWYFARIEHPERKGERAIEWRKVSYTDVY